MAGLGIIAGSGALPKLIAQDLAARGLNHLVVDFYGNEIDWGAGFTARFEQPEAMFAALRNAGCSQVVMAGGIVRPELDPSKFDATFAGIIPKLGAAMAQGDDAALAVVLEMFEVAGFEVVSAQDVLSTLLADEGVLGAVAVDDASRSDAARAAEILSVTGALDIGQGCVVADGLCLALESLPGTAAMLEFVRQTRVGTGGVLLKAPKAGQDRRVDLPAIGPDTIDQLAAAGLFGLVIAAREVLVIDRAEVIRRADAAGVFVWSRA